MMTVISPYARQRRASGFALVATISVMVLLVMIALAMLTLSTIETRASDHGKAMQEARANARMGLMLALGELQKQAGPDQRITAWSNILDGDPSPSSSDAEGVALKHCLGVWNSWKTYITDEMEQPVGAKLKMADTYVAGREPMFRRWLFSYPDSSLLEDMDSVLESGGLTLDDENSTRIVAAGSLGDDLPEDEHVRAGLVDVGNGRGSLAWWIGGDNLKASLDVRNERPGETSLAAYQLENAHSHFADPSALSAYNNFPKDSKTRNKLVSPKEIGLLHAKPSDAGEHFFAFGSGNRSLLVDVRRGGVKRDLNSLFEQDDLPSEFGRMSSPANQGVELDAPIRTIDGSVLDTANGLMNPHTYLPSWAAMKDYYRLYRSSGGQGLQWDGQVPYTRRQMEVNVSQGGDGRPVVNRNTGDYTRVPLILRLTQVIGLMKRKEGTKTHLDIVMIPIVVLWNPYNVEMRYGADEFLGNLEYSWTLRMGFKWWNKDTLQTNDWKPMNDLFGRSGLVKTKRRNLKKARFRGFENTPGNDIVMQPGEVAMFSVGNDNSNAQDSQFVYRGYIRGEEKLSGVRLTVVTTDSADSNSETLVDPEFALRFGDGGAQQVDKFGYYRSALGFEIKHTTKWLNYGGIFDDSGSVLSASGEFGTGIYGLFCSWFDKDAQTQEIISEDPAVREPWPTVTDEVVPVAIVNFIAKSGEQMVYPDGSSPDYRCRNWLHAPVAFSLNGLGAGNDISRVTFPYVLHYDVLGGSNASLGQSVSIDPDTRLAYAGGGNSIEAGVSHIVSQEIPTAPITDLSGFASMRLRPATVHAIDSGHAGDVNGVWWKYGAHHGAAFGPGIGNGYAHPLIPGNRFFHQFTGGEWTDPGPWEGGKIYGNMRNRDIWNDHWDQLLLTNDALYDTWFCSSLVPETKQGKVTSPVGDVREGFFLRSEPLGNQRLLPHQPETMDMQAVVDDLEDEPYDKVAAYMTLAGGFNINSTSVEAWRALLYGLKERQQVFREDDGTIGVESASDDGLLLSRYGWAPGNKEGDGAESDENAWRGIRRLTDEQIDRLAEEIVRQVKLRGPFLNMSDFINRRLDDTDLGVAGALQAAIDWDEYEDGYTGGGNTGEESINGRFKGSSDMISSSGAPFPNKKASRGSRYAGIAGYVMASDVLRALGGVLTPRCDTFTIRSYGESKDAKGRVVARAWCEAKVQRIPDFVDSSDRPWEVKADLLGKDLADGPDEGLKEENKKFGRRFHVVAFRWLAADEI